MKHRKVRALRIFAIFLTAATLYFVWPLYGFVSSQSAIMRLPFGWLEIPSEAPTTETVLNSAYKDAAEAALEAILARRNVIGSPAISTAVAVRGEIVWSAAVGWADVENSKPATPETIFRIGSCSKAVTATALATLVDAGLVDLDAEISEYFSPLPNREWRSITARQLASHTAGLPDYEQNTDWLGFYRSLALRSRYKNVLDSLDMFDGSDLLFEPGTDFHYSAFGIILLSAVIQKAAKEPFEKVLEDRVFRPLDLTAIGADGFASMSRTMAQSYQRKDGRVKPWRPVDLSHKLAAGGFAATPTELAKLGSAWLNEEFISARTRKQFWTPVRLSDGRDNAQSYALGWRRASHQIRGVGEVVHFNHGGVSKGAQCWLMVAPDHDIALAISINSRSDDFGAFAGVFVDILQAFIPIAAVSDTPRR